VSSYDPVAHARANTTPEALEWARTVADADRVAAISKLVDALVSGSANEPTLARINGLIVVIDESRHLG
jgi:hypothetical protein